MRFAAALVAAFIYREPPYRRVGRFLIQRRLVLFRRVRRLGLFAHSRGTFRGEKIALKQQFDEDNAITLGTLGAGLAILGTGVIDNTRLNGFRLTKSRIGVTLSGKTTAEGPIAYGVSCNVSAVELAAILQADPQSRTKDDDRGDGAFVYTMGVIGELTTAFPGATPDGPPVMVSIPYGKNGWSVIEGDTWALWAFNMGAQLTTGTVIKFFAEHYGVWLRD